MVSQLHSTDNFSATEAQVHLKLAKCSKKTCSHLNPGESPNSQNALILVFYWRLSYIYIKAAKEHPSKLVYKLSDSATEIFIYEMPNGM